MIEKSLNGGGYHVFYCQEIISDTQGNIENGFATQGVGGKKQDEIFVNARNEPVYTLAHEIGHRRTRMGHYGSLPGVQPGPNDYGSGVVDYRRDHNLMRPGGLDDSKAPTTAKRFYAHQQTYMYAPKP